MYTPSTPREIEAAKSRIVELLRQKGGEVVIDYPLPFISRRRKWCAGTLDILLSKEKKGVLFLPWKRPLPVSQILFAEEIIRELGLKQLFLICNGVSYNATQYIDYRQLPIKVIWVHQINRATDLREEIELFGS